MSTSDTERVVFDTADPDVRAYPLLTASVVPRPIAWVTSRSADGVGNLAPHSFYTVACANPPIVQFTSVGAKDTLRNVRETGEFVINLAGAAMVEAINGSSARYDAEVDEAQALDVRLEPSALVSIPRVADSPVSIECRLHSTIELGDSTLVLGDVVAVTVRREVLADDGLPDFAALQPLSRLGRNEWGGPPPLFALDRPHRAP
ncbi:flavin reductase family protein [Nocardioides sp. Bht2]|uniref:flavin reductase family protein n=1 Tax=Nocardioides sp. Bht2 TaxID=3392297 RepID=UPI0039B68931